MIDSTTLISASRILTSKESCFNSRGTQISILSPLAAEEWCSHPAHFIPGNRAHHTISNASSNPVSSLQECKYLFVPFSIFNVHWIIFRIDYRVQEVIIFDPMQDQNQHQAETIAEIWMNLAEFIYTVASLDSSTSVKFNTVKSWPLCFAHNDPHLAPIIPKQVMGITPAMGCAIHCIVFMVNSTREVHTSIDDLQAFKLRHLIKFIIETSSPNRCARSSIIQPNINPSTSNPIIPPCQRDDAWQDEFCSGCGQASSARNGDLIACDAPHCSHVYHYACANTSPQSITDKWLCPFCI